MRSGWSLRRSRPKVTAWQPSMMGVEDASVRWRRTVDDEDECIRNCDGCEES